MRLKAFLPSILIALFLAFPAPCVPAEAEQAQAVQESSVHNVPRAVLRSSYRISVYQTIDGKRITVGFGSGIAIDETHIITAGHVADDPEREYTVDEFDDQWRLISQHEAKIIRTNGKNADEAPDRDLAVLELKNGKLKHFRPIEAGEVKEGDEVYTVGAPSGCNAAHVSVGRFSGTEFPYSNDLIGLHYANVSIQPGNSGCGIYDSKHRLLGICVRGGAISGQELVALYIPVRTVQAFLVGLEKKLAKKD